MPDQGGGRTRGGWGAPRARGAARMEHDVDGAMAHGGRAAGLGGHVRPQPAAAVACAGGAAARRGPRRYGFRLRLAPDRCGCRGDAAACVGLPPAGVARAHCIPKERTALERALSFLDKGVLDEDFDECKVDLQRGVDAQMAFYGDRGGDLAVRLRAVAPFLAASTCPRSFWLCDMVFAGYVKPESLGAYWPSGEATVADAQEERGARAVHTAARPGVAPPRVVATGARVRPAGWRD